MERHLSCRAILPVLQYVENHNVDLDVFLKGLGVDKHYLRDNRNWVSRDVYCNIFNRCEVTFNNPLIMYEIGKEYWSPQKGSFSAFMRLICSPSLFIRFLPNIVSFVSKFFFIKTEIIGRHEARVFVFFKNKDFVNRHGCLYNLGAIVGYFSYACKTKVWVREEECICKNELASIADLPRKPRLLSSIQYGCPQCTYHIRWVEPQMASYMNDFLNENDDLLNQALLTIENKELSLQEKEEKLHLLEIEFDRQTQQDFFTDYNLSKREQQIVSQVAKGRANKQISDHLCISTDTVKKHLFNVYQKVGIKSRTELVARMYGNDKM